MKILITIILLFFFDKSFSQVGLFHAHNTTDALPLMLDTYSGAQTHYSVMKNRTAYTGPLMKVRESGGNTEQDIYPISGGVLLDETALLAFVGSNSGYVVTWYDQSGNGRNLGQADQTMQPRIVNAGVMETQNSIPSIKFDGVNDMLATGGTFSIVGADFGTFIVQKRRVAGVSGALYTGAAGGILNSQYSDNNIYIQAVPSTGANGAKYRSVGDATATFCLLEGHYNSSAISGYKNGASLTLTTVASFTSATGLISQLGRYGSSGDFTDGHVSEITHWNTDQSTNRAGIASNINSRFTIY